MGETYYSTDGSWQYWNITTSTITTATTAFTYWIDSNTTTNSATTSNPWTYWNGTVTTIANNQYYFEEWADKTISEAERRRNREVANAAHRIHVLEEAAERRHRNTPEYLAEQEKQREIAAKQAAEYAENQRKLAEQRNLAIKRAQELLEKHLTEEQLKELSTYGKFSVIAPSGKVYEIERGRAGNIYELDEARKKRTARICCHVQPYDVPDSDNMLAQKLHLEHNEKEFINKANVFDYAANQYRARAA